MEKYSPGFVVIILIQERNFVALVENAGYTRSTLRQPYLVEEKGNHVS